MFRKRPFLRRPPFNPRQALMRANRMKDGGNYVVAAEIFEQLGKGAQDRGLLDRAPHLFLQAAHCRLLATQTERGFGLMSYGLHLLAETKNWLALHRAGGMIVSELNRLGYTQTAGEVQAWIDLTLKDHPLEPPPTFGAKTIPEYTPPKLPTKCPFCGATIRPDLVEWLNEVTAECLYCGSSIPANE